jgi:hypothetical protein
MAASLHATGGGERRRAGGLPGLTAARSRSTVGRGHP